MSRIKEMIESYFKEPVKPITQTKDTITLPLKDYKGVMAGYRETFFELEEYRNHYIPPPDQCGFDGLDEYEKAYDDE